MTSKIEPNRARDFRSCTRCAQRLHSHTSVIRISTHASAKKERKKTFVGIPCYRILCLCKMYLLRGQLGGLYLLFRFGHCAEQTRGPQQTVCECVDKLSGKRSGHKDVQHDVGRCLRLNDEFLYHPDQSLCSVLSLGLVMPDAKNHVSMLKLLGCVFRVIRAK